jgi:hypothetical protein
VSLASHLGEDSDVTGVHNVEMEREVGCDERDTKISKPLYLPRITLLLKRVANGQKF